MKVIESRMMKDIKGSHLHGGRNLIDTIEQNKADSRKKYLLQQELKREHEERTANQEKLAEKTPYEKTKDIQEQTKKLIKGILIGSPGNEEKLINALWGICVVLDYLLIKTKSEEQETSQGIQAEGKL